jgi:hypothetical protein
MGTMIDKFEGIILNSARRIISAGVFILLLGMIWNFFGGSLNSMDGPNVELEDRFDMPTYQEPEFAGLESSKADSDEDTEEEEIISQVEKDYKKELDAMTSDFVPLYVSLKGMDADDVKEDIREYFSTEVGRAAYSEDLFSLNEKQRDDWVDGAVDYVDDFADYMVDKYDISRSNPVSADVDLPSVENAVMRNPLRAYEREANALLIEHAAEATEAAAIAMENNERGDEQLMNVGYAILVMILLVLILIIFKAENSLRRSADSMEKS